MRPTAVAASLLLLAASVGCLAGGTKYAQLHSWPQKGLIVFVSRALQPDYTPFNMASEPTTSSGPVIPQNPACEPVEVRSVDEDSVVVRWLKGGPADSTVEGDWKSFVHKSKEECIERLKARAGAAATGSASVHLTADTPGQTVGGATFIAPADWTLSVRGPATILEAPEGDSRIALVDVCASTVDSAVALAWAEYMPDHKWPLQSVTRELDEDGWSERNTYAYQTSPGEQLE